MKRTISVMVGKGSVNHNSRKFHAKNTDPERSDRNVEYCNQDIREVYHELFDEALKRYNQKQTRNDRRIDDYYEKIYSSKQEKPFHEVILQIGNKDDMSAKTEEGQLAAEMLDEYMKGFQERNPTLKVFSAYLHMDEATPHLHIDFVPFMTGSKRGLDTRVSLKQALAKLGFKGGTRSDTEWNQWVASEKRQLAMIMERYGIEWEQKGTHEKHLSVLDYEKKERAKEVAVLEEQISSLEQENATFMEINETLHEQLCNTDDELRAVLERRELAEQEVAFAEKKAEKAKKNLSALTGNMKQVEQYAAEYTHSPDEWLPAPTTMESAKSYRKRILPLIMEVVKIIRPLYAKYLELKDKCNRLRNRNTDLEERVERLHDMLSQSKSENEMLHGRLIDFERAKSILGVQVVDDAIQTAKQYERTFAQQKVNKKRHSRDAR